MPQVLERMPYTGERAPTPKRWTRRECAFLADNGLLEGRYELVDGEIIAKMGQKPPHRIVVILLRECLIALFGGRRVQMQAPVDVSEGDRDLNEPEPDAAVTSRPADEYRDGNPPASDVLLAVEVSDTTLAYDRTTKARLYARAAIADYWVVDITGRRVLVHRNPVGDAYQQVTAYDEGEAISPLARPDSSVAVAALLPPAAS